MWVSQFLWSLLYLSPWLLVDTVAVILVVIWRRRHRRVSFLIILAVSLSLVISITANFLVAWLPEDAFQEPYDHSKFVARILLISWIGIIRSILGAMAYSLLIVAVFIDRPAKAPVQSLIKDSEAPADKTSVVAGLGRTQI
jgi:hypothetical protein